MPRTIEVTDRPIRGYDWKLIREPGMGTYARIAGVITDTDDQPDDEELVIEEYGPHGKFSRESWDNAPDAMMIDWAYDEIMASINA